jgi:hypothetical protein
MKPYPRVEDLLGPVPRVAMPRAPRLVAPGRTKGTGHLLEANWLISLETDFHSLGVAGRRGPS